MNKLLKGLSRLLVPTGIALAVAAFPAVALAAEEDAAAGALAEVGTSAAAAADDEAAQVDNSQIAARSTVLSESAGIADITGTGSTDDASDNSTVNDMSTSLDADASSNAATKAETDDAAGAAGTAEPMDAEASQDDASQDDAAAETSETATSNGEGSSAASDDALEGDDATQGGDPSSDGSNATETDSQGAAASAAAKASAQTFSAPISDGYYVIKSGVGTGMVVDVEYASSENGANVQLYEYNGTDAQIFEVSHTPAGYYTFKNVSSGKVLEVAGAETDNGTNVQQGVYNGATAQKWIILKVGDGYEIRSALLSTLRLDVFEANTDNETNIQIYRTNGTAAQLFYFINAYPEVSKSTVKLANGVYAITPESDSGLRVALNGGNTSAGASYSTQASGSGMEQKFYLERTADAYYRIINLASGLALGVEGGSIMPDAAVEQQLVDDSDAQLWSLTVNSDGTYSFTNKAGGTRLSIAAGGAYAGSTVGVNRAYRTDDQHFLIKRVSLLGEGVYTFESAISDGKMLEVPDGSAAYGTQLEISYADESKYQMFKLEASSLGGYTIQSVGTGMNVSLAGLKVIESTWERRWAPYVKRAGDRYGIVLVDIKTGYAMQLADGSAYDGTGVVTWHAAAGWGSMLFLAECVGASVDSGVQYYYTGVSLSEFASVENEESVDADEGAISDASVAAIINPDTYDFGSSYYYQFLDLTADAPSVTAAQLDALIESKVIYAEGNYGVTSMLRGCGKYFIEAQEKYGINAVYLLAHAALESAWGCSSLARGVANPGFYNFYGIHAYDNDPGQGGTYAEESDWSTPQKAILGAAEWIAKNYITPTVSSAKNSGAQNTLWKMRWDVLDYANTGSIWHQYATDPYWARSIASIMGSCYSSLGISGTNSAFSYLVPVFSA